MHHGEIFINRVLSELGYGSDQILECSSRSPQEIIERSQIAMVRALSGSLGSISPWLR